MACHGNPPNGSSPRVRGGLGQDRGHGRGCRLIPASAGRTKPDDSSSSPNRAHPRECGADQRGDGLHVVAQGSSPRVRGGRRGCAPSVRSRGLIPASAGRTRCRIRVVERRWAHPRECGADRCSPLPPLIMDGSSPRVRGGQVFAIASANNGRLIPASAGRTQHVDGGAGACTAHPRECGADGYRRLKSASASGSSPRVRGGRLGLRCRVGVARLIPASAGRTVLRPRSRKWATAHPRECGADRHSSSGSPTVRGSSPRVRGGRNMWTRWRAGGGLIPASAGRTPTSASVVGHPWAHPRECGADSVSTFIHSPGAGSSPRVRGGHRLIIDPVKRQGLIPASAGRTSSMSWS